MKTGNYKILQTCNCDKAAYFIRNDSKLRYITYGLLFSDSQVRDLYWQRNVQTDYYQASNWDYQALEQNIATNDAMSQTSHF